LERESLSDSLTDLCVQKKTQTDFKEKEKAYPDSQKTQKNVWGWESQTQTSKGSKCPKFSKTLSINQCVSCFFQKKGKTHTKKKDQKTQRKGVREKTDPPKPSKKGKETCIYVLMVLVHSIQKNQSRDCTQKKDFSHPKKKKKPKNKEKKKGMKSPGFTLIQPRVSGFKKKADQSWKAGAQS
jgi:hypothetical protein